MTELLEALHDAIAKLSVAARDTDGDGGRLYTIAWSRLTMLGELYGPEGTITKLHESLDATDELPEALRSAIAAETASVALVGTKARCPAPRKAAVKYVSTLLNGIADTVGA